MPSTTRTFVALAVPPALSPKLKRLQEQLAGHAPGWRWEVVRPFHVTLAFLGDVEATDLNDVCRAVAEASSRIGKFSLTLEGLGAFPDPARPRVVWAGVGGPGLDALTGLRAEVAAAVARARYPTDDHAFRPHVTLGRAAPRKPAPVDLTPIVSHYKTWHAGPFEVAEVVTFSSTLAPGQTDYAPLARAPLARKPARD